LKVATTSDKQKESSSNMAEDHAAVAAPQQQLNYLQGNNKYSSNIAKQSCEIKEQQRML